MSPGSERGIISICLKNNDKLLDVEEAGILPHHFGVPANRYIYIAMQYLFSKKQTPTPISIMEVITSEAGKKSIDEIGGMTYVASLLVSVMSLLRLILRTRNRR